MIGAVMWMAYGGVMDSAPVFVANLLVLIAAAWTASRSSRGRGETPFDTVPRAGEAA